MAVTLNHTVIDSHNKEESAEFLARILGLGPPGIFGPFATVEVTNGVSLDFRDTDEILPQHYAFLVDDGEFDAIFERVQASAIEYYSDPFHKRPGEINTRDSGRAIYFDSLEKHRLEVLTRPHGTGQ